MPQPTVWWCCCHLSSWSQHMTTDLLVLSSYSCIWCGFYWVRYWSSLLLLSLQLLPRVFCWFNCEYLELLLLPIFAWAVPFACIVLAHARSILNQNQGFVYISFRILMLASACFGFHSCPDLLVSGRLLNSYLMDIFQLFMRCYLSLQINLTIGSSH